STYVRAPGYIYTGTVLNWGTIDRSIPIVAGLPQISDAQIRVADENREWRDILSRVTLETFRRRILDIRIVREGDAEETATILFSGEVVNVTTGPAWVEFNIRDRSYSFLDEKIPALAIKEIFPQISDADEGGFIAIVGGNCVTVDTGTPSGPRGQIPCPH